jgi:sensor domain CHASE-containing protein
LIILYINPLSNQQKQQHNFNAKVDLLTSELKGVVEDLNSSRNASVQLKEQLSDDIKIVKGITDQIKAELVININTLMTNAEELKNNLNCEMKKVKDVTEFFKTEISADLNASRNIAAELKKNLNNEIQAVKDVTDRLKTEIVTDITTSRSVATKLKEELNKDIALIKDVTVHLKTEIANEINEVKLITANLKEEIYKDMNISRYSSAQLKHELFKDIHTVRNIQEQRRRELENVYQSLSWRLTYPLREGNRLVKVAQALSISFLKAKGQKTKTQLRPVLLKTILFIKRRPFLYRKSMLLLKSFPQFSDKLRGVYIRNLVTKPPFFPSNYLEERIIKSSNGQVTECGNDPRLARLSQPARRLYIELNSAALKSKGI